MNDEGFVINEVSSEGIKEKENFLSKYKYYIIGGMIILFTIILIIIIIFTLTKFS